MDGPRCGSLAHEAAKGCNASTVNLHRTTYRGDAVRERGLEAPPVPAAKSPNVFQQSMRERMHRKLSTAEVAAVVERAFARQEGREPRLSTRTDNPVIGELASLETLEYELQRDTAAAGLGIRVSALDKLVKGWRAATEDENTALPHWNVEPSAEPVDGAALLNELRQVFRRYVVLPKGADIALPLWVLHAWTMDAGDISPLMVLVFRFAWPGVTMQTD